MGNRVPDIFISYSSKNHHWVSGLAAALKSANYRVWWDEELRAGDNVHDSIPEALEKARCVLVVWCENSVKSEWVQGEASRGNERGVLIPVLSQPVTSPMAFSSLHKVDFCSWEGEAHDRYFQKLVKAIDYKIQHHEVREISQGYFPTQKNTTVANPAKSNRGCSISVAVTLGLFIGVISFNSSLSSFRTKQQEAETALIAVTTAIAEKQHAVDKLAEISAEIEARENQNLLIARVEDIIESENTSFGFMFKPSPSIDDYKPYEYGKLPSGDVIEMAMGYFSMGTSYFENQGEVFRFAGHGAGVSGTESVARLTQAITEAENSKSHYAEMAKLFSLKDNQEAAQYAGKAAQYAAQAQLSAQKDSRQYAELSAKYTTEKERRRTEYAAESSPSPKSSTKKEKQAVEYAELATKYAAQAQLLAQQDSHKTAQYAELATKYATQAQLLAKQGSRKTVLYAAQAQLFAEKEKREAAKLVALKEEREVAKLATLEEEREVAKLATLEKEREAAKLAALEKKREATKLVAIATEVEKERRETAKRAVAEVEKYRFLSYLTGLFGEKNQEN